MNFQTYGISQQAAVMCAQAGMFGFWKFCSQERTNAVAFTSLALERVIASKSAGWGWSLPGQRGSAELGPLCAPRSPKRGPH